MAEPEAKNESRTAGPLLVVEGVSKSYPEAEGGGELQVLREVSFTLEAGESISIVGPSGCGKSTLLNVIATLDDPTTGTVRVRGDSIHAWPEAKKAAYRAESTGLIFQLHHLLPQCTVLENVLVPTLPLKKGKAEAETRARKLLDRVGLGERLGHRPAQLSGGERQRVAVARALINEPALLLADEPTGALDGKTAESLADLLFELNREEQTALVIVTHSPELASRAGKTYSLQGGQLAGV